MATTHVTGMPRMHRQSATHRPIPFASTCPKCRLEQPQRGFSPAALVRVFSADHPIEAYCAVCDEYWVISPPERAAIAMQLNR